MLPHHESLRRRTASRLAPAIVLCVLAACGEDAPEPPSPSPGPGGETITGRERIGWTQQANDAIELATFGYAIYIDGTRVVLGGVACGTTAGANGFECSAQLPQSRLPPGRHVLELASFITSGNDVLESSRSTPLEVTVVAGVTSAAEADASDGATVTTPDGVRLRAEIVARGLDDPADLAFAPDGRLIVAERGGRIRVVDPARGAVGDAGRLREVGELVALALDPAFARTRRLYLLYTARADRSAAIALRLVRATELNGALGQAAVLFEEPVARVATTGAARFGADGMLYLGLGDGGDPRRLRDPSSPLAKILRVTADGGTPRDNPGASPIISAGHRAPSAIAWHPDTGALWEVERSGLHDVAAGTDFSWLFPRDAALGGAAFAVGGPFHGDLFVASPGTQDLLRVRFADGRPASRAERLLDRRFGRLGQVVQGPDTALYVTTANQEVWGPATDLLIRLSRVSAP